MGILRRSAESVISQTVTPKEVIITDSGTSLSISKEVRNMASLYSWKYVKVENGASGCITRNRGAEHATGRYLAFLDDDDEWYHEKISRMSVVFDKNPGVICSDYDQEVGGDVFLFTVPNSIEDRILGNNVIGCTSMPIISREAFEKVGGFDESFESNQEWDLWIRICDICNVIRVDGPVGIKHQSSLSVSSDSSKRVHGWNCMFRKHSEAYRRNPYQLKIASGCCIAEMRGNCSPFILKVLCLRAWSGLMVHLRR